MTIYAYFLYPLFVIACIILILVVLLQPGKGDVASALGGGAGGAAFGPRGTTSLLAKITIGSAICFMTLAFLFSVPGVVTPRSVTSGIEVPDAPAPVPTPVPVPAGPEGAVPVDGTAIPAGQISVDENGKMTTTAPGATPAPEGAQPATPVPAPTPAPTNAP